MTMSKNKIALILGKGAEGCGVTRYATEMWQWGQKHNVTIDVFSYDEFFHHRGKSHILEIKSFNSDTLLETVDVINTYDIAMFHSYPSSKFNKSAVFDFYHVFVKGIKCIKVGFMHELTKTNIDKIPYLLPLMNQMDTLLTFTENSFFAKTISELLPSKVIGKNVIKFTMMYDFEKNKQLREKYPLEQKNKKMIYCSRWTTMKDPKRVLLLDPILKSIDAKVSCELHGIERSMGAKIDILDRPNVLDKTRKLITGPLDGVPVHGPYVREEGLELMASSLFVASFYRMPKDPLGYGDRMEFTQIETISVGSIPIFDKHWGENNRTKDGTRYIDIPYSAIYSDVDDLEETAEKIKYVANNTIEQQKYIDTSYEIVKSEFDVNEIMPKLIKNIINNGHDKNKYLSEKDLILNITQNQEFVDLYEEYNNKGEIVVFGIKEMMNNIFSVIDGKKEIEIKTWKKPRKNSIIKNDNKIVEETFDDLFIY